MQLHCYLIDALDDVLTWDLPDEDCANAVTTQAGLLAGIDTEQLLDADLD